MLYSNLSNNILSILRTAKELHIDQVFRFFEEEYDHGLIDWYIRILIAQHKIKYNELNKRLVYHMSDGTPEVNETIKAKRISAFWVIADVGSQNIDNVFSIVNGGQFFFESNGECYEIATILNKSDAISIRKYREENIEKFMIDDVIRIALVKSQKEAEKIKDFGFDSYCILNKDKRPVFCYWDDEENSDEGDEEESREE